MRFREYLINVALILIVALAMTGYVLHLPEVKFKKINLRLKFQYDYVVEAYKPRWLCRGDIGTYPSSHFISDIPWISYNKSYCATTCLQMIVYKYEIREQVEYFNFIMGFTYGAYLGTFNNRVYLIPGGDPFAGYVNASKILNLKYNLLVTDDRELFIDACRHLVSKDIPVILPVNMSRLYHLKYFAPHFELLAGFDEDDFYIYEPVQSRCIFKFGEKGYRFPADLVVKAVEDMSAAYNLPWKYAIIYFIKGGEPAKDLRGLLTLNGRLQIGHNFTMDSCRIHFGSYAFKMLADYISKGNVRINDIIWSIGLAYISRVDNARFLKERFPDDKRVLEAAEYLIKAAEIYKRIMYLAGDGVSPEDENEIISLLKKASEYEKEAGISMIEAGS
ncbi:hypothetical protein CW706_00410 [Candidatus Bathyarchaeota archaeon]|nr:MAG: hypothetical protein CW706_00410 [Candidatus Bathyarchaeota archaeon]